MAAGRHSAGNEGATPVDVLLLFPDDWAAYSPTLLRLTQLLSRSFRVRAHVLDTGRVDNSLLDPALFRRIEVPGCMARLLKMLGLYRPFRALALARSARKELASSTRIVAIDADGAVASRLLGRAFHFLSLEVGRHPVLKRLVDRHALSVTIQSPERLEYLLGIQLASRLPVFYIQNAPDAPESTPVARHLAPHAHPRLVYLGHVMPLHGLVPMLELLKAWPEASLTLQGIQTAQGLDLIHGRYQDLLDAGRLIIGKDYVQEEAITAFLSRFDIGLCFYELGKRRADFNYQSSPAGKMFNYFAAGLPVIASDLIGLRPVSLHRAGIQVPSHDAAILLEAGRAIMANYTSYSEGASRAAVHYDFRRSAEQLLAFLRADSVHP